MTETIVSADPPAVVVELPPADQATVEIKTAAPQLDGAAADPEAPVKSAPARPETPRIGDKLTCELFEDGLPAAAEVKEISEDERELLLWIPRLGRDWPIMVSSVAGSAWAHDDAFYPPIGVAPDFDQRFRPPKPVVTRTARRGHVWARAVGHIAAAGFSESGLSLTSWAPGQLGEFPIRVVKSAPDAFTVVP